MSTDSAEKSADRCCACANCGIAEIDAVKLKDCDKCDLARYCGDECQQDHLEKHEAICKERADELRDEILFKQPEGSHSGDCPICFLPLPLGGQKSTMYSCCGKIICDGCCYANQMRELNERLEQRCPFCRNPARKRGEEIKRNHEKRAEANDPAALCQMGKMHYNEGEYGAAFEYWTRAAELGDAVSHYNLAVMYREEEGVEKDEKTEVYHLEEAAIAGHPYARHNLGSYEFMNKSFERAVRHWIIAAKLGLNESVNHLKQRYKEGHVSKDDFAAALRGYQAAVDAMKSPQRDEADAARKVYF